MKLILKPSFTFLFCCFAIFKTHGQPLPDSIAKKIDDLFLQWNKATPGCAVGIVRNDSLIYAKGFGMANLEHGINNSPQTIFHIASVSKQFTAWAIVQLAREGKVNLDDNVRKYLPWFPDLKAKITIRNLLNHTSGIRDQWQLAAIAGTRLEDVITQEQLIKILSKQQALNFMPGEQYLYSSSGYTMLAEIVHTVTGKTLRQFTGSVIFRPLGMNHTHFHDDYTEIENNRAYSYSSNDGKHFSNAILNYSTAGATSLFTNIEDMSKWIINFYKPSIGNEKDIDTLTNNVVLKDGTKLSYACGIVVNTYKGWRQYSHSGTDAGYQSFATVFPDKKIGFIVFGNSREFYPQAPAYAMADLFISDTVTIKKESIEKIPGNVTVIKDTTTAEKFAGDYIGADGLPLSFELSGNQFYYHLFDQSAPLVENSKKHYSIAGSPDSKLLFDIKGKDTSLKVSTPEQFYFLKKYTKETRQPAAILKSYIGNYYSPELDCSYSMALKGDNLFLSNNKYDIKLSFLSRDYLLSDYWWMNHLHILHDNKNNITGFEVNSNGVMHLKFYKKN